ncbi:hypothetical protein BT63DRAFT_197076 [Microthyrium microscopicum]|uniref:Uncharacterized protein n=1 Tax=Microthyrium microscopicum TaxID=703497 RepID=A0A6A6UNL0_9PEZI|nr:hypothetical protein BT63DRAFT_197076 [Microthyrium microscopicum]
MFCLRSWIPILFFLTNASPIYLVLFISATYIVNRPCVYCSLLLAILVISLFDFHTDDWFEPRYRRAENMNGFFASPSNTSSPLLQPGSAFNGSMLVPDVVRDTLAVFSAAVNNSMPTVAGSIWKSSKETVGEVTANATVSGVSGWIRNVLRKEWRIDCLDIVLRL